MAGVGRFLPAVATLKIGTNGSGQGNPCPEIESPSILITAGNNNSATIFFYPSSLAQANDRRKHAVPLTAGQSFSLTGVPIGVNGYRNVVIGTGLYYGHANSTPQYAVFTYYKQS